MTTEQINILSQSGLGKLITFLKPGTDTQLVKEVVDEYCQREIRVLNHHLKNILQAKNPMDRNTAEIDAMTFLQFQHDKILWFISLPIERKLKIAEMYTDAKGDKTNIAEGLTPEAIKWLEQTKF